MSDTGKRYHPVEINCSRLAVAYLRVSVSEQVSLTDEDKALISKRLLSTFNF